ncbi:DUF4239 domain-containing protein [Terriglobus saanensis]|uniref:DUF4239 domain-containing protein n=1 Tax=Terriglobus saanensis (strain ATCC BAA-1853 / DSM 23119 / SP1PR4) TaxID=401053 RepID=E8UYQ2_TERSS|nr:DUF4239 domain-containing protein [Terriglobus saanensis]ADV83205.1 hypothetical protein AciPR4_2425 [Terriglobus saanensis SP1PR4]
MLSYLQSVSVVLLGLLVALLLSWLLNRLWSPGERKGLNDVMGWQLGVLGTTYAVILGFMLSNVWTAFRAASMDVNDEAVAVLQIFHAGDSLPDAPREAIQDLTRQYAVAMIQEEWPAMTMHRQPDGGEVILEKMWKFLPSSEFASVREASSDRIGSAVQELQHQRYRRQEQYESHLPAILWAVLIAGAIIVLLSSCLLGNDKTVVHYFHVLTLTLMILVTLTAIADIDRPFEGGVSVRDQPFRSALATMNSGH